MKVRDVENLQPLAARLLWRRERTGFWLFKPASQIQGRRRRLRAQAKKVMTKKLRQFLASCEFTSKARESKQYLSVKTSDVRIGDNLGDDRSQGKFTIRILAQTGKPEMFA
jgi:hypothetical protein